MGLWYDGVREYLRAVIGGDPQRVRVTSAVSDRRATRLLARKVLDTSEDYFVRESAYDALRDIWFSRARRRKEDRQRYHEDYVRGELERQAWVQ
jgi:hypothetical protein